MKIYDVIDGCTTIEQLTVAEKYLELWNRRYGNNEEANKKLFSKKMKLNHGWNN
jgi:hypothetical protein